MQNRQVHAPGNNYNCDKFIVLSVLLQKDGTATNRINGQYFFPEMPELNNKTITGLSISMNDCGTPGYTTLSNSVVVWYNGFITLYNQKNEQVIYNIPLSTLNNFDSTGNAEKILPINTKLNLRQCYVNFAPGQNLPANSKMKLNLVFFYNYK
jgi:hypothetical protein